MRSKIMGWPGDPPDSEIGPTDLQESVLMLLEDAGIDAETNDQIVKLIEAAEIRKAKAENDVPHRPGGTLTGTDRVLVDRLWREPEMHDLFREDTYVSMAQRGVDEYERMFRIWGKGLLDGGRENALAVVRAYLERE